MRVAISVRTREGVTKVIEADEGQSLMEALRAAEVGVLGTCGGMCSCGSCHVFASDAVLAAAPPVREDEQDMLDALADVIEVRSCSRLACQIPVTDALAGAELEIGPQL